MSMETTKQLTEAYLAGVASGIIAYSNIVFDVLDASNISSGSQKFSPEYTLGYISAISKVASSIPGMESVYEEVKSKLDQP